MGGPGSGNRWRFGVKSTTSDYRAIDVRRWARHGMLKPGYSRAWQWSHNGEVQACIEVRAETDRVMLIYRYRSADGESSDERYPVRIVKTQCHFGGSRPWFICPAFGCGRRVGILYGGRILACRHCYQLAYASAREDATDRAMRRADRLRERMGWRLGIANFKGDKPKWMRWRTFYRLNEQHDELVIRSMHGIAVKFGLLEQDPSG